MNIKQKPPRTRNFEADADDALAEAREMPPGQEKMKALKRAGQLRNAVLGYGVIFAKRGRPPK